MSPTGGSIYCTMNGIYWMWCSKCNQWACHNNVNCHTQKMGEQHCQQSTRAYVAPMPKLTPNKKVSIASSNSSYFNGIIPDNTAFLVVLDIKEWLPV
eukprot:15198223-Ditylum_brightwellii.AAC.1